MKEKKRVNYISLTRYENGWRVNIDRDYKWSYKPEKYFFTDYKSAVDLLGNLNIGK